MITIAIRTTYYIFCCRNKNWDSPDLMQVWFLFFSFFFLSFFSLNNPSTIIQAAFVNCPYVVRFTISIVHSKTQIKFPLLSRIYKCTFYHKMTKGPLQLTVFLKKLKKLTFEFWWKLSGNWLITVFQFSVDKNLLEE